MASAITIDASFGSGKPLSVLSDLIKRRVSFLSGETTESAVTATAINILTGIRARTKKANPNVASQFGVKVFPAPGVEAGYKSNRGTNQGHRVVREIGGHEFKGAKVVNIAGMHIRGEKPVVCHVIIKSPKLMNRIRGGYERIYVITKSVMEARKWAERKLKKYIRTYAGTAKWIIGQAQSQVAQKGFSENISPRARALALKNLIVSTTGSGWGRGNYSVYVGDRLDYAKLALENGEADFDLALKRSANRTAAIINKLGGYSLDEKIPTPFPEVKVAK